MDWLNYHHLLYFWTVVQEQSVSAAARKLRLRQPTVSAQIRALEQTLGRKLFAKQGRNLRLTEHGVIVARYAEQIFRTGRELVDVLNDRLPNLSVRLLIGVADAVPKHIAQKLIAPVFDLPEPHSVLCEEDTPERLLARLAVHELDLVISDVPIPPAVEVKAFTHLLGESAVALFGAARLRRRARSGSKVFLSETPLLLPTKDSALRRQMDQWIEEQELRPLIRGEFQDSALMKIFGHAGNGIFPAPLVIREELEEELGVVPLLTVNGVSERFYAISLSRQIRHPSILEICDQGRRLFNR